MNKGMFILDFYDIAAVPAAAKHRRGKPRPTITKSGVHSTSYKRQQRGQDARDTIGEAI
jgi:hypothetical protein